MSDPVLIGTPAAPRHSTEQEPWCKTAPILQNVAPRLQKGFEHACSRMAMTMVDTWRPIAKTCEDLLGRIDVVAAKIVDAIRKDIYAHLDPLVPTLEHRDSVRTICGLCLEGLASRRLPKDPELEARRELGHRRAMQGVRIDALIQSLSVGHRMLAADLVETARESGVANRDELIEALAILSEWFYRITRVVADAHHATSAARERHLDTLRQRFVELAFLSNAESAQLRECAATLGFDPEDSFHVTCVPGEVRLGISSDPPGFVVIPRANATLFVAQRTPVQGILELLAAHGTQTVGMSETTVGVTGLSVLIEQAQRAMTLAGRLVRPVSYGDDWTLIAALGTTEAMRSPLDSARAAVHDHPHLAETVMTFAAEGFSVSAVARVLSLSASTVSYRLKRWKELTGRDPHQFSGLSASVSAIVLAHEPAKKP